MYRRPFSCHIDVQMKGNKLQYVARAAVELSGCSIIQSAQDWHVSKYNDGLECRWRFSKNRTFEVIAGTYGNRNEALDSAKNLYVQLIYKLMRYQYRISDSGCTSYETRFYDRVYDYPMTAD